jgi:sugar/nucleoside kinase (ribokinase family)
MNSENKSPDRLGMDYLVVGHITEDITPQGVILGGGVTYSALTAKAMGLKAGIITACAPGLDLSALQGIEVISQPSPFTTTFKNISQGDKRDQYIYHRADIINPKLIPGQWKYPKLVHFSPVADEMTREIIGYFPESLIGLTVQGLLRGWGEDKRVYYQKSPELEAFITGSSIVILSIEDVNGDEATLERIAHTIPIVVATEGSDGARVFWKGDSRRFRPPHKDVVDTTGAGDIYAAAFFGRYIQTLNPWEAGRFATLVAAESVTRFGIASVPTDTEIENYSIELGNRN